MKGDGCINQVKTIKKRNGKEEPVNIVKVITVLQKADPDAAIEDIKDIANTVLAEVPETTEELRKNIETILIERGFTTMAKNYVVECYKNEERRNREKLDKSVLGLISRSNEEVMNENANKNPVILSTQRDLIAGELNKDIARKYIFPKNVMNAHDKGAIHIHDLDYAAQQMTNCCLINLEDMLQNGTVISGVKIDKPKSLRTAATLTSQISAAVAGAQFGKPYNLPN